MIDQGIYLLLGNYLLDQLRGKINLRISSEARIKLAEEALKELVQGENFSQYADIYEDAEKRKEFISKFFSYDALDELLHNEQVEDIGINGINSIFAHMTNRGLVKIEKGFPDHQSLSFFLRKLVIFSGRHHLRKVNDLELPFVQGRVNIVHSPYGPQITITKIKEIPLSIIQLIQRQTLDYKIASFLWLAVEGMGLRPANILIVGGPGAGKTTLLNALLSFVPRDERVVTIEDTLELHTQSMDNFSILESDASLTLEDLVKNTLRMRPDRIIIGEVRGREARDMMTAMNIGKYCLCTIHAPNTKEAFARLEHDPMNVSPPLLNLIDILVVLRRYRKSNSIYRVIEQISETSFAEQRRPLISVLWEYSYKENQIKETTSFTVYREKLAEATGGDSSGIIQEWDMRAKILHILSNKNISAFHKVTDFCTAYHRNKNKALESIGITIKDLKKMPSEVR